MSANQLISMLSDPKKKEIANSTLDFIQSTIKLKAKSNITETQQNTQQQQEQEDDGEETDEEEILDLDQNEQTEKTTTNHKTSKQQSEIQKVRLWFNEKIISNMSTEEYAYFSKCTSTSLVNNSKRKKFLEWSHLNSLQFSKNALTIIGHLTRYFLEEIVHSVLIDSEFPHFGIEAYQIVSYLKDLVRNKVKSKGVSFSNDNNNNNFSNKNNGQASSSIQSQLSSSRSLNEENESSILDPLELQRKNKNNSNKQQYQQQNRPQIVFLTGIEGDLLLSKLDDKIWGLILAFFRVLDLVPLLRTCKFLRKQSQMRLLSHFQNATTFLRSSLSEILVKDNYFWSEISLFCEWPFYRHQFIKTMSPFLLGFCSNPRLEWIQSRSAAMLSALLTRILKYNAESSVGGGGGEISFVEFTFVIPFLNFLKIENRNWNSKIYVLEFLATQRNQKLLFWIVERYKLSNLLVDVVLECNEAMMLAQNVKSENHATANFNHSNQNQISPSLLLVYCIAALKHLYLLFQEQKKEASQFVNHSKLKEAFNQSIQLFAKHQKLHSEIELFLNGILKN